MMVLVQAETCSVRVKEHFEWKKKIKICVVFDAISAIYSLSSCQILIKLRFPRRIPEKILKYEVS